MQNGIKLFAGNREKDIAWWRERIQQVLLSIGALLNLAPLLSAFLSGLRDGSWAIFFLVLAVELVLVALLLAKRLPLAARTLSALAMMYGVALLLFFLTGLRSSSGFVWLFAMAVIAGALLDLRAALAALALNALTLLVMAWVLANGPGPSPLPFASWPEMIGAGLNFMVLNIMAVLSVSFAVRGLEVTLGREKRAVAELDSERSRLRQEIQTREAVETALRESETDYRRLFEDTSDFVYTHDLKGRLTSVNPAICRALGLSHEEVLGRCLKEFMHPRYQDQFESGYLDKILAQGRLEGTSIYRVRGGRDVIVEFRNFLVAEEGQPAHISGMGRDVTERAQAIRSLRESQKRYRTLFNESPDAISITQLDTGRVFDVNDGFCRLYGCTREEVIGRTTLDLEVFVDVRDRERFLAVLKEKGRIDDFEIRFKNRSGEVFDTLLSARKMRYVNQDCLVASVRDLSPVKKAEREKERLAKQLQQAQKMESIGTFAGGIAHDFNNILAMVMGYGELAQQKASQGLDNRDDLERIVAAAERARNLVKQLLTFSRKSEAEFQALDLDQVIIRCAGILERTLPRAIDLRLELGGGPELIRADPIQMEQVIMNLANNARDAMPQGGSLTFRTEPLLLEQEGPGKHPEVPPGRYLRLTVADTGQGMDEETREKIFEPFFTTKGLGQGAGLGLSTVYGIVREHRGRISCHSEPGLGTTFRLYFPVHEAGEQEAPKGEPQAPASPSPGRQTILLVDDEEPIRRLGTEFLEGAGYRVVQAKSGEEALDYFRRSEKGVDLVILDLGMPGMGGNRCLAGLLSLDPGVKVLVASGYSAEGSMGDTLQAGASAYLTKPYRLGDLLEAVRDILGRDRTG